MLNPCLSEAKDHLHEPLLKAAMQNRILKSLKGHLWTLVPHVARRISARGLPDPESFSVPFQNHDGHLLTVEGLLDQGENQDSLFVIIHGIGSNPSVAYVEDAARVLRKKGSVLRLALRGSLGRQPDFYHGGLTDDLHTALASARLSQFRHIYLVGFSLGGHVALRYCAEDGDQRVRAVVGICPPINLGAGQRRLDHWSMWGYRTHILSGLLGTYGQCEAKASALGIVLPQKAEHLRSVRTIREWDSLTVVPRFGFESVDDYYQTASVGHRISALRVPALILAGRDDPIVPFADIEPYLTHRPDHLEVAVFDQAGHVGFMPNLSLGQAGPRGLYNQLASWCMSKAT